MGIKDLNKFLKENASPSIKMCNLQELSGKKIAVDISIYMYRFATENALIENMYLMMSIFTKYNIIPIFVFDGKSPPEKKNTLQKRKQTKQLAEEEYHKLHAILDTSDAIDFYEKQRIICELDELRRKMISIHKYDVAIVKKLIIAHGYVYCDANGEADEVCAYLNIHEKVWACLSDDTDMFVYGCKRVLRYLSLLNHTIVIYDVESILYNLGISQEELRAICVMSGTDYSDCDGTVTLAIILKKFKTFRKSKATINFYEWLHTYHANMIKDYDLVLKINNMYNLQNLRNDLTEFNQIDINNGNIRKDEIKLILKTDGFLFA